MQPQDGPDGRIARQALWLGAVSATQLLGSLVQVVIAVRILGLEGYGALAVIVAAASLIHGLLSTPGGNTVITYVSRSVAEGRRGEAANTIRFALATSLALSLVAYGIIAALALAFSDPLGLEPGHANALLLYGIAGVLLATQSETLAVLRLAERVAAAFFATLAATLVHVGVLLAVWFEGGGLLGVVSAGIAAAATNGALLFILAALSVRRAGAASLFASANLRVPPDLVRFHIGIFGTSTVTHLTNNVDTLLVAHFAGSAEAGMYRAARLLVDTARAPFAPIGKSLQVEFSKQWYALDGATLRRTARRYTVVIASGALLVFATLALLSEPLVAMIYGAAFAPVVPLLLVMIPGSLVVSCFAGVSTLPHATGQVGPVFIAHVAAFTTSALALLVLVPTYGAMGGAYAFLVFAVTWGAVLFPFIVSTLRRSYERQSEMSSPSTDEGRP